MESARKASPYLSIVVPLYNEAENVRPLHDALCDVLDSMQVEAEILLVDDGSCDGTVEQLQLLLRRDARIRVLRLLVNSGQTMAMQVGIQRARGDVIVTLDGDLQNDPRDIPLLLSKIEAGFDLVVGWRKNRQDRLVSRKIPSRIANWCIARFLDIPTHDLGCTLKAYRAELIRQVPLYSDLHRFIPAVCSMASTRIGEVVVRHHPRRRGKSKYGMLRTGRVILDTLTVKMLLTCARRPLLWFGAGAGVAFVATCTLIASANAANSAALSTFSLFSAGILMGFLSLHLVFAGIVGEVIICVDPQERIKPLYDVGAFVEPRPPSQKTDGRGALAE